MEALLVGLQLFQSHCTDVIYTCLRCSSTVSENPSRSTLANWIEFQLPFSPSSLAFTRVFSDADGMSVVHVDLFSQ